MYEIYEFRMGDTLEGILSGLGITEEELKRINGIIGDIEVIPGKFIIVPKRETRFLTSYTIQKGDTLYEIARKYGMKLNDLALLNGLDPEDYIYVGEKIMIPTNNKGFYITKEGDTIRSISEALSIEPSSLLRQNENLYLLEDQVIIYEEDSF